MSEPVIDNDAVSLSTLPPDIIRMIIPMIDEPFKTKANLVSRTWNTLTTEYKRKYRLIHAIGIYMDMDEQLIMRITLNKNDLTHFGLDGWSRLDLYGTKPDEVTVNAPLQKRDVVMSLTESLKNQEQEICCILKRLSRHCYKLKLLSFMCVIEPTFDRLQSCLGSLSIDSLGVLCMKQMMGGRKPSKDSKMAQLNEMTRKHKISTIHYY